MNIIETAQKEIIRLESMLGKIDIFLNTAPEGCLKWQNKNGKIYYYQQYQQDEKSEAENTGTSDKWKRKYIRKRDIWIAAALAQKHYLLLSKPIIEKQLRELRRFAEKFLPEELEKIYDSLSPERKLLVKPLEKSIQSKLQQWEEEKYEKNTKYSENLKFETMQGEMVRSKSEVIIANMLYQNREHISYKYERPLELLWNGKSKIVYPDFTIINKHTGKIVYWEHAGRMDDPYYANDFVRKTNSYVLSGLTLGKELVLTYETQNTPLEISVIKETIKRLL